MDLTQISLFSATSQQIRIHRERTFEQWGRGLSMEEFVKRDEAFAGLAHATDGKFALWVLALRKDPSNPNFLSSCETFQREAVASPTVSSEEPTVAYGVASVYTPPEHRRKGYAKHMMRLLHYVIADQREGSTHIPPFPVEKWGRPPIIPPGLGNGIASALYSDVGPLFYRSCGIGLRKDNGWVVNAPYSTIWPVPAQEMPEDINVERLNEEAEKEVWEQDAELIRREVQNSSHASFSFLPIGGVAEFQQARSFFFTPQKSKGGVWGVRLRHQETFSVDPLPLSFATWCLDPGREGPQTLLITRLRCTVSQFPVILAAAFQAAQGFQLEQVEIWNLDEHLRETGQALGGVTSERHDHLPSFAWYGPNGKEMRDPTIRWRYNEKFCWC